MVRTIAALGFLAKGRLMRVAAKAATKVARERSFRWRTWNASGSIVFAPTGHDGTVASGARTE